MFDQLGESSLTQRKPRRAVPLILAVALHALVLGALLLVSPLFPDTLPMGLAIRPTVFGPPVLSRKRAGNPRSNSMQVISTQRINSKLLLPSRIPADVVRLMETEPVPAYDSFGVDLGVGSRILGAPEGGVMDGVLKGWLESSSVPPLPSRPEPAREAARSVVHVVVGGRIQEANLIIKVTPVYPPLARQARVQGSVVLAAVIGPDGTIEDLQVVSGHPMLVQAAVEAVKQWRYRPTLLNGSPTRVDTTIAVNFSLAN